MHSRDAELDNVAEWAVANNLQLNRAKSVEIIFTDRRRKSQTDHPPTLPDIRRVNSIKVLGDCFTNHLSMNDHIHDVIGSCGQSLHAFKVLRSHGMNDDSLRDIYKAVVLAKLFYASPEEEEAATPFSPRQPKTGSELMHSFVAVSDSVYTALANQHPRN